MKKIILNLLSILFGLFFIHGGLNKIFNYLPMPDDTPQEILDLNNAMGSMVWLIPLLAVSEALGGLLIMFPKTRALGVLVVMPLMVGILLTHIFIAPNFIPMSIVLWAILIWMIIDNKKKFMPLIK